MLDSSKADADAHLVADVIRHHGLNLESFDVIALNEVWDEDAKKILKNKLAPVFPYHVDKLDENTDLLGLSVPIPKAEDSSLMLFSRMPFVKRKEPSAATWYLTLQRKSYTQKDMKVGWRTNLTWLTGLGIPGSWPFKLVCGDETGSDWTGSDEIDLYIDVDEVEYSVHHFGDVDSKDHRTLEGVLQPVAFLKNVRFRISENDPDGKYWNERTVIHLDPKKAQALQLSAELLPGDGNYEFRYNFAHTLNLQVAP